MSFLRSLSLFLLLIPDLVAQSSFQAEAIDKKIGIGYGLATGDVDGDGKTDILLADQSEIVWYKNPGKKGDTWPRFVLAANLTPRDNVCIAARDIDGDGKVEIAVGAQWNPAETKNDKESGAVFYLIPSNDRTQPWEPVRLYHEVTIHRMHWVKTSDGLFQLVVLPLHGEENTNGDGKGVNLIAFDTPQNKKGIWSYQLINTQMHMTHNFHPLEVPDRFLGLAIAGKEGVQVFLHGATGWAPSGNWMVPGKPAGEVRTGSLGGNQLFTATVEPMHGTSLVVYTKDKRTVVSERMKGAHAIVCGDFIGQGRDQVVVGWREPNENRQFGVRLFVGTNPEGTRWEEYALDEKIAMACEDLKAVDLDGDGDLDVIAAGRSTKNVVVYWNLKK